MQRRPPVFGQTAELGRRLQLSLDCVLQSVELQRFTTCLTASDFIDLSLELCDLGVLDLCNPHGVWASRSISVESFLDGPDLAERVEA